MRERGTDRKIKSGEAREGGIFAVEYSPFPRKLRNVNRKIRAVSLYTGREGRNVCMNGKREAACSKKMRIRGEEGEKNESLLYTRLCILRESFLRRNYYVPDRDVSFAEMDGAPVRFFLSLHYTTFVNHEWVSDASMRASGVSSFFLASLFLQAVIRSRGNTEKLRHAPRQVPIDIESLLLSLEIKGARSLSLSFFLSFVDNWKGYYREQMEVENRRYSRKFTPRETV